MPARDLDPPLVRVLLKRSTAPVVLPQPGRAYRVMADSRSSWLWGPLKLTVSAAGPSWWQVGAFSDESSVSAAIAGIEQGLGTGVQIARGVTAAGLTRLRVRWIAAEPADPAAVLVGLGFEGSFRVAETGTLRIEGAEGAVVTGAGEFVIEPAGDWPVAVGDRSYRGILVARAVGNETLLINQLNLERYLQGVVPAEMGPSQFPELDALKAQAVAARTYTVAHLGDHADEGWDLCDTPACQVYNGVGVEHSLSNRAIEETAGLIAVFAGQPIDAMYTSTCGGHTEDAALLFSGRAQPYLVGVPCAWERPIQLVGTGVDGSWVSTVDFSASVAREFLELTPGAPPIEVLQKLQRFLGRVSPLPEITSTADLSQALLTAVGVEPPEGIAPAADGLERLLYLADLYDIPLDPPTTGLEGPWPAAAALAALELSGEIERDSGEVVPRPVGAGIFPRRADHGEDLPTPLPLWEQWSGGHRRRAAAEVLPGTLLERLRRGDRVVALTVRLSGGGGEADRRSAWREWVRERSWPELERSLGVQGLERLTVTARSPSGRVIGLAAVSRTGRLKEIRGFEVRRALDLPETLFSMNVRTTPDGERRVHFLGRGWGHGVGLCQNGAYGLARSGMEFEQILEHYYTGIELVRWAGSAGPAAPAR
jgi:stage II sporulation protein D